MSADGDIVARCAEASRWPTLSLRVTAVMSRAPTGEHFRARARAPFVVRSHAQSGARSTRHPDAMAGLYPNRSTTAEPSRSSFEMASRRAVDFWYARQSLEESKRSPTRSRPCSARRILATIASPDRVAFKIYEEIAELCFAPDSVVAEIIKKAGRPQRPQADATSRLLRLARPDAGRSSRIEEAGAGSTSAAARAADRAELSRDVFIAKADATLWASSISIGSSGALEISRGPSCRGRDPRSAVGR